MATVTGFDLNGSRSGLNEARAYVENAAAIDLAPVAKVSAIGNFAGQTLRISGLLPETRIGFDGFASVSGTNVRISGTTIGTITGGSNSVDIAIAFNTNATAARIQTLIQELTFASTSDAPAASQAITFNLAGTVRAAVISVTAVNDVPQLDLNGAASGTNGAASIREQTPTAIAPAAILADVDSPNLTALTATLTTRPNGDAVESLALGAAAAQMATAAGLVVSDNAATGTLGITGTAPQDTYQAILRGVVYNNLSDAPTGANRTIRVTANDGQGPSAARDLTVTLAAVNDAPVLDLNGSASGTSVTLAWRGGDPAIRIAPAGSILDADSANFNGGSLRAELTQNGTLADQLVILADGVVTLTNGGATVAINGTAIGTVSGGGNGAALVIGFTSASATPANVQAVLDRIGYTSTAASTATKQVTFTLNDGDGTANGGQATGSATATIALTAGGNIAPVLTGDLTAPIAGAAYVITTADLSFTDPDDLASGVTFTVSGAVNGGILVGGVTATGFTGQQLAAGAVSFRFSAPGVTAASFVVSVEDGNEDGSTPVPRTFQFTASPPPSGTLSFANATQGVAADLAAASWHPALRIMPFGDSITNGDAPEGSDEHGYRGFLWQNLAGNGVLADFVGPNSNGLVPDADHAGYPGETADDLLALLPSLLATYAPGAVLLLAGANDVLQETNAQNSVGPEIRAMLDLLTQRNPATTVYVSAVLPLSGNTAEVDAVNVAIRAVVAGAIGRGENVRQVEMPSISTSDLFDGIHPTDGGYMEMAGYWTAAILADPPASGPFTAIGAGVATLTGSAFNDLLTGDGGANSLLGGGGNDWLAGGGGADTLSGGTGRDTLIGGQGADSLSGGAEADAFAFAAGFGSDTLADFRPGEDRLDLRALGLNIGNFNAWLGSHAVTSGVDTIITIDADNTIALSGVAITSLRSTDFAFA